MVLYADSRKPLLGVIEDTVGKHETIYGYCINCNNKHRSGAEPAGSCYPNFTRESKKTWHGRPLNCSKCKLFMSVPIIVDGSAGIAKAALKPRTYISLKAGSNVLPYFQIVHKYIIY